MLNFIELQGWTSRLRGNCWTYCFQMMWIYFYDTSKGVNSVNHSSKDGFKPDPNGIDHVVAILRTRMKQCGCIVCSRSNKMLSTFHRISSNLFGHFLNLAFVYIVVWGVPSKLIQIQSSIKWSSVIKTPQKNLPFKNNEFVLDFEETCLTWCVVSNL